jgi:hypothetical protein
MNPVPTLEQIFTDCDKNNSLNIESTEWTTCFPNLCAFSCTAGTSCQACESNPMDVFECYETNEQSGINVNEFTSIADAISAGTFDSTMVECLKPDTVEEKCKDIYDSSTTIGPNSGSNGLAFLDFY